MPVSTNPLVPGSEIISSAYHLCSPVIGSGSITVGNVSMSIDGNLGSAWTWQTCTPTTSAICNTLGTSHGFSRDSANGDNGISLRATDYLIDAPTGIFDIPKGNVCLLVAQCAALFSFNVETSGSVSLSSLIFDVQGVLEPGT